MTFVDTDGGKNHKQNKTNKNTYVRYKLPLWKEILKADNLVDGLVLEKILQAMDENDRVLKFSI